MKMAHNLALVVFTLAIFHGLASAQFNVLPVFAADSVINEHKGVHIKNKTEMTPSAEAESKKEIPIHPKLMAGVRSEEKNSIDNLEDVKSSEKQMGRVKREETPIYKSQVRVDQRAYGRNTDIDSFLSELEKDIAKSHPTRYNSNPVNQAPSWSYKPSTTSDKPFWRKWGDSIGSTYSQVKAKTKDIVKGLSV